MLSIHHWRQGLVVSGAAVLALGLGACSEPDIVAEGRPDGGAPPSDGGVVETTDAGSGDLDAGEDLSGGTDSGAEDAGAAPIDSAECVHFPGSAWCEAYYENLAMIQASTVRSRVEDTSPYRDTPQDDLVVEDLLGPRTDYVDIDLTGGDMERAFPSDNGVGNFRISCEFSHFAYDDPFLFPGQPGRSYLQMFFGNTDVNAYSTYESLRNTGGATCNGNELNRSGYWVPAMFDGNGNVRIPDRVVIYYKGYGLGNGNAVVFPEQAAIVSRRVHTIPSSEGGAPGEVAFKCSDQFSANDGDERDDLNGFTCNTEGKPEWRRTVVEVVIKFPQCYVGSDPADFENSFTLPQGNWFGSNCEAMGYQTLPNIEYFVNYALEDGETADDWYLASDVDPETFSIASTRGENLTGSWWGGWRRDVNEEWVDGCVNHRADGEPAGCGFGYLSNAGPDGTNPRPGRALRLRQQYTGPVSVPAATVFEQLCNSDREITTDAQAAWCNPE